jgi:hypothetical protein
MGSTCLSKGENWLKPTRTNKLYKGSLTFATRIVARNLYPFLSN